jgi:hypothetical protein
VGGPGGGGGWVGTASAALNVHCSVYVLEAAEAPEAIP